MSRDYQVARREALDRVWPLRQCGFPIADGGGRARIRRRTHPRFTQALPATHVTRHRDAQLRRDFAHVPVFGSRGARFPPLLGQPCPR